MQKILVDPNAPGVADKDIVEAVKVLAKIGTPETKDLLRSMIFDNEHETAVKVAAVSSLDWTENLQPLKDILDGVEDYEVIQSAVKAIERTDMDDFVRQEFSQQLLSLYIRSDSPELRITILDYFRNKPEFVQVVSAVDPGKIHPVVIAHIQEIYDDRD